MLIIYLQVLQNNGGYAGEKGGKYSIIFATGVAKYDGSAVE